MKGSCGAALCRWRDWLLLAVLGVNIGGISVLFWVGSEKGEMDGSCEGSGLIGCGFVDNGGW